MQQHSYKHNNDILVGLCLTLEGDDEDNDVNNDVDFNNDVTCGNFPTNSIIKMLERILEEGL